MSPQQQQSYLPILLPSSPSKKLGDWGTQERVPRERGEMRMGEGEGEWKWREEQGEAGAETEMCRKKKDK